MRMIFLILIGLSSLSFAEFSKQNGVVSDSTTKLEWQDDYSDNGGDIKQTIWISAIDYCEALSLDGGGWRLPNIRELESLVDDSKYNLSINGIFEFTSSNYYWSATSTINFSGDAWVVGFNIGYIGSTIKHYDSFVRCVRDMKKTEKKSRFIKINNSGEKLDDSAGVWSYVYDTKTSILWENKIDKDNVAQFNSATPNYSDLKKIHDYDNSYSVDNVNQIIQSMNNQSYFNVTSWALPSSQEFIDLIKDAEFDKKYFPNFEGAFYSSTIVKNGVNSTTLEKVFLETGQKSTGMPNYTYKALFVVHDYSLE